MTKKHFIELADKVRAYQETKYRNGDIEKGPPYLLDMLADFCESQNERFNRERWLGYIAGTNGKNGGSVKQAKWTADMVTDAQARLVCHLSEDQPVTLADRKITAADFNGTKTPTP